MVCVLSVFFSFFLSCFFLYWYFPWQTLTLYKMGRRGNNYFSCFPVPPANELSLIFTLSICNYSWWDLFSLDICTLFAFLWMHLSRSGVIDFDISKWHYKDLSSCQTITLLLQSERLNKLRFTPLPTTGYLSHLPSPTPSHNLTSKRFAKCIRNKGCLYIYIFFFERDWKKNNKKQFPSFEIRNDILIYISIKRVFLIDIDYTRR